MQNENSSRFSLFKLDHDLNHFARKIIIGSKIKIIFKTHIFLYETRNIFITTNENPMTNRFAHFLQTIIVALKSRLNHYVSSNRRADHKKRENIN